ncbi:MAG: 16S/23S rRNA (cytidine-2'-O)-methyltransferase TlyA [Thermoleophilaceae bacterium]
MSGQVRLGSSGERAAKPGQLVADDVPLSIDAPPPYVSRAGTKLENALMHFGLDPSNRDCLDVGASTGGFSDCLIQRGARHVTAVDVGSGLLDWRLRNDERVTVIERQNARTLDAARLPYRPTLIVVDVSFISLTKVLPAVLACAADDFDCLALVKPQFEVGRERVGKGGVVRDPHERHAVLTAVGASMRALGESVMGYVSSGLPGPAGNRESFIWIRPHGDPRAREDIAAAAAEVEQ